MNRYFYQIPLDQSNPYKLVCLIANYPHDDLGDVVPEYKFGIQIGLTNLYSLSSSDPKTFECLLDQHNIAYRKCDLEVQYQLFIQNHNPNEPIDRLETSFLCDENVVSIAETEIPEIICASGTSRILLEEEISRKDKMKIYVHSNERCGHHIPHVHAKYNDNENYCVINLVDVTIIQPKDLHNAKTKELCKFVNDNLQNSRAAWNRTNSLLKFKRIGDDYSSTYSNTPQ